MGAVHAEGAEAALPSSCVLFENFLGFQLARISITLLSVCRDGGSGATIVAKFGIFFENGKKMCDFL